MNRFLNKLLSRNLSPLQMAGFVLANLFGMAIVLTAVQFSSDVIPLFTSGDSFMKPGQIVVVKHVSAARTLSGVPPTFSRSEIEELSAQPFTEDIGVFTPSRYSVFASIGSRQTGMGFATEMFFEAIPDPYIDVDLSKWHYTSGGDTLPIILPRNYLNLYNFGFAASRGMPTISEGIVGNIGIRLILSGTHGQRTMTGKVVAFSRRLNTILVPQTFMDESNQSLAPEAETQPSRLILSVHNPADERIATYLQSHNYDTETTDAEASRTANFLRLISVIVIIIGLVISVLAFYVLLLSIFLLLQKHTEKIDSLLLIGYHPATVARFYYALAIGLNVFVLIAAFLLASSARKYYLPLFGELYPTYEASAILPALLAGIALFALVSILNYTAIHRKVMKIWDMHKS